MPIIEPDLSEMQEFTPIAPGTYAARIAEVIVGTSKKGNPMLTIDFAITVDGKDRKKKAWTVTSGAGSFNFFQLLRATGFEQLAEQLKNKEKVPFNTDLLIGQELSVVIESEVRDDNGELSDSIKTYLKR